MSDKQPAMRKVASMMPRSVKWLLKKVAYLGFSRYCPVCKSWLRLFKPSGDPPRPDARCPVCWSLERQRLAILFLEHKTDLFDGSGKNMLQVAPEDGLEARFRRVPKLELLTADLDKPTAMVRMDLTNIQYPDESFDVIYCSHVLEHITDDRKAMRELARILKSDGWSVLMVPITANSTFEDPSISDPVMRRQLFGQHDHVRRYGPDFIDRLEGEGFEVKPYEALEVVKSRDVTTFGVAEEQLFFCKKRNIVSV